MTAIITDLREFRHPLKRISADEMNHRSLVDIQDPDASMPTLCSRCGAESSMSVPLKLEPVDRDPKALVRSYLYRSVCALGCKGRSC